MASAITSVTGVRCIVGLEIDPIQPRFVWLDLRSDGGKGSLAPVLELDEDGQSLRVRFRDGAKMIWNRCV